MPHSPRALTDFDQLLAETRRVNQARAARAPRTTARATPVVRALAARHAVDLDQVHGTGTGGRITRQDVLAKASRPAARQEDDAYAQAWGAAQEPAPVTDQAYLNAWGPRPAPAPVTDEAYVKAWGPEPELPPVTDAAYLAIWGPQAATAQTDDAYAAAWGATTDDPEA